MAVRSIFESLYINHHNTFTLILWLLLKFLKQFTSTKQAEISPIKLLYHTQDYMSIKIAIPIIIFPIYSSC